MVDAARRTPEKFALRLPEGMREKIARIAEANNRSSNAEIVARLEESLANDVVRQIGQPLEERLSDIENDIEILKAAILLDKDKVAASTGKITMMADLYKDEFKHLIPTKK